MPVLKRLLVLLSGFVFLLAAQGQTSQNPPAQNPPTQNPPAQNAPAQNSPAQNPPAQNPPAENQSSPAPAPASASNTGQAAQASGFVGSNVCRACHPDIWANFYKNPHFKSIASAKEPPDHTGCEGCHGPGLAHIRAGGGKATIIAFSELPPGKVLDNCLRCHAESISRANIRRSSHTLTDIVCTNCHSIHKSPVPKFLLAKRQIDLCYGCHNDVRAQFSLTFKHRVNEGFMVCTDCHNPHGAPPPTWRLAARPRMVDQVFANEEACLKCHAEKRGPFIYEHEPVRVDGCETCHYPHGSTNSRLLRRPVVFTLCLECHNGVDSFGRHNNGILTVTPDHNLASPIYQNCTTCHVRVHGSNADALFMR